MTTIRYYHSIIISHMTCCRRTRNECLCQCQTVACISPVCLFLIMSSLLLLFCFVRCLCRLEPALSGDKAKLNSSDEKKQKKKKGCCC
ncbi:unnamed protein product [Cladocopium goreaui]|uniref:Uncharacterized protein n=1 Tax=Cladocopium goreaui TaxID=2562237 RepID=A0A9P1FTV8_9DINO|nr:unnamed protein product [Cladocopium goreaui]